MQQFTYQRLVQNSNFADQSLGFYAEHYEDAFFVVNKINQKNNGKGWKLHLSVVKDDIARAWNVIVDYMINNNIGPLKVVDTKHIDLFSDPNCDQAGKIITVFMWNPEVNWTKVVDDLEVLLKDRDIKPGPKVYDDKGIKGSSYISYRNDRDEKGNYQKARDVKGSIGRHKYNPSNLPDPFVDFSISQDNTIKERAQTWLNRILHPKPDVNKLFTSERWTQQSDNDGKPLLSTKLDGLPQDAIDALKARLIDSGYHPFIRSSQSLGSNVLSVLGNEAVRLGNSINQSAKKAC